MSLTKSFFKAFLINITIALILVAGVIWFTMVSLNSYTHHGETITVPDLRGWTIEQVDEYLKNKNLKLEYVVMDSSFSLAQPPGVVLDQDPIPYSKVKEDRKIYVTINALNPPKVKMPKLVDKSLRQATLELGSWGLKVGELKYRPDLAQNAVLEQQVNGVAIEPGDLVAKGSEIDLVLGDGLGNTKVETPNLYGLTLDEAKFVLTASSLNLGGVMYDETEKDSSIAYIYKQYPRSNPENPVMLNMGESIDIYLTYQMPDTIEAGTDTLIMEPEITEHEE